MSFELGAARTRPVAESSFAGNAETGWVPAVEAVEPNFAGNAATHSVAAAVERAHEPKILVVVGDCRRHFVLV